MTSTPLAELTAVPPGLPAEHGRSSRRQLAYIVNLFPNFIETMIYREVAALRGIGEEIAMFSIRRPAITDVPEEAWHFIPDTSYILPIGAFRLLSAHLAAAIRRPIRYWTTLFGVLAGTHERRKDRMRSFCHFAEAVTLLDEMRTRRVEHIHAHWAVGSATCAMVVSRLLDIPFSFTAHAYDIWRDKLLLAEKLRAASFIVTCTDYNRRYLAATYSVPPSRLRVVHHGVDVDRFKPVPRIPNSEPLLLSVGRLVEQKGFDRLLQACAALSRRGCRFRCEIVGDGPLRGSLEMLARNLGVDDRVTFFGRRLQEELIHHYAAADLFVLPCIAAVDNDRDGIPNTLIEAMAMEVAVVSTRFSGIPELVTDETGFLVEPGDSSALASAIAQLLDRPDERRNMGRAGRRRVLNDFTIEGSARRMQAIFASFPHDQRGTV